MASAPEDELQLDGDIHVDMATGKSALGDIDPVGQVKVCRVALGELLVFFHLPGGVHVACMSCGCIYVGNLTPGHSSLST